MRKKNLLNRPYQQAANWHRRTLLLWFLVVLLVSGCSFRPRQTKNGVNVSPANKTAPVCFDKTCFTAEIAATPEERARGLMFRSQLPPDAGMLFIFPKENFYGFWMKNTLIPLDIIWLNKDKKVVDVKPNAPPCQTATCPNFQPNRVAQYVLEINAGLADKMELKVGSYLSW